MLVGLPTILIVKFCSKALAKWILPIISNTLSMPIRSTSYIPMLNSSATGKVDGSKQRGSLYKLFFISSQDSLDVDTGIRFVQYAGLAWSVVDLVPSLFSYLNLWYVNFKIGSKINLIESWVLSILFILHSQCLFRGIICPCVIDIIFAECDPAFLFQSNKSGLIAPTIYIYIYQNKITIFGWI